MISWSRATDPQNCLGRGCCGRETNIFYSVVFGSLYVKQLTTMWLIHQPGEKIWECCLVGLQEREGEAVGENMEKQLVYWTPVFYYLFSSYSYVSKCRHQILTHIKSLIHKSTRSPVISYVWKITMVHFECCMCCMSFVMYVRRAWKQSKARGAFFQEIGAPPLEQPRQSPGWDILWELGVLREVAVLTAWERNMSG